MIKFAAIDVGSNAMRLAIGKLDQTGTKITQVKSLRQAVRLGGDVFDNGIISQATTRKSIKAFKNFRSIIEKSGIEQVRAVGTSALREAKNREQFVRRVQRESSIRIDVISGQAEAKLIQTAVFAKIDYRRKSGLLIDIGGGSVEVSIIKNGAVLAADCSPMGTVRLLRSIAKTDRDNFEPRLTRYGDKIERLLRNHLSRLPPAICAGTGGNIEEIGKLRRRLFGSGLIHEAASILSPSGRRIPTLSSNYGISPKRKDTSYITRRELTAMTQLLTAMTYRERQARLRLRPDRADVIIPAVLILGRVLDIARVSICHIPGVGVKDGLLLDMLAKCRKSR